MLTTFVDPILGELHLLGAAVENGETFLCLKSQQGEILKLTLSQFKKYAPEFGVPF